MTTTAKQQHWAMQDSNLRPLQCEGGVDIADVASTHFVCGIGQFGVIVKVEVSFGCCQSRMTGKLLHNRHWVYASRLGQKRMPGAVEDFLSGNACSLSHSTESLAKGIFCPGFASEINEDVPLCWHFGFLAECDEFNGVPGQVDFSDCSESFGFVVFGRGNTICHVGPSENSSFSWPASSQPAKPEQSSKVRIGKFVDPKPFFSSDAFAICAARWAFKLYQWIVIAVFALCCELSNHFGGRNPRFSAFVAQIQTLRVPIYFGRVQFIEQARAKRGCKSCFTHQSTRICLYCRLSGRMLSQKFNTDTANGRHGCRFTVLSVDAEFRREVDHIESVSLDGGGQISERPSDDASMTDGKKQFRISIHPPAKSIVKSIGLL